MTSPLTPEALHIYAREVASTMSGITAKLIRWNDIVQTALDFYPSNPKAGVVECLQSCVPGDVMFDGKSTLAASLQANYRWML